MRKNNNFLRCDKTVSVTNKKKGRKYLNFKQWLFIKHDVQTTVLSQPLSNYYDTVDIECGGDPFKAFLVLLKRGKSD